MQSLAPYAEMPAAVAADRAVYDRQNYRLIGRMWERVNARSDAPLLQIWKTFIDSEEQGWLPLGEQGVDRWFVRCVNASVWMVSTNTGSSIYNNLVSSGTTPDMDAVTRWFQETEPDAVNWAVHECSKACFEPYYHTLYGWNSYCQTKRPVPREAARTFYITMTWLLTEPGHCFVKRYRLAIERLHRCREIGIKNSRRRHAAWRRRIKASV